MASPGAELEALLVRTGVISLALQTLVGRLVSNGTLDMADLAAMRDTGSQLATDLQAHGGTGAQIAGAPLEGELAAWWDVADVIGDV
jgi:hypothetical protein